MTIPTSFNQDIQDWLNAQNQCTLLDQEYSSGLADLIAQIKAHAAWVKGGEKGPMQGIDPAQALWLFQTQLAPLISQHSEYSMQAEADSLNIATDLRNEITSAQTSFSQFMQDMQNGQTSQAENDITSMNKALNALKSMMQDPHMSKIFTQDQVSNITGFISGITNVSENSEALSQFITAYSQSISQGGPVPPDLNTINTAFNNLNQSVSGISSSVQTQMQYMQQNLQQFFAVYKSIFDDYSTLSAYIINQTHSSS